MLEPTTPIGTDPDIAIALPLPLPPVVDIAAPAVPLAPPVTLPELDINGDSDGDRIPPGESDPSRDEDVAVLRRDTIRGTVLFTGGCAVDSWYDSTASGWYWFSAARIRLSKDEIGGRVTWGAVLDEFTLGAGAEPAAAAAAVPATAAAAAAVVGATGATGASGCFACNIGTSGIVAVMAQPLRPPPRRASRHHHTVPFITPPTTCAGFELRAFASACALRFGY